MKICIATDFHLSYRQYGLEEREHDFYERYNQLVDEIIKEKPDLFIELGDVFDTPYPKPIAIKVFEDGLKKLEDNGIRCYGIIGNHTLVQRNNFYPIDKFFDKLKNINEKHIIIGDVCICGVDYHPKTHGIKESIDYLYDKAKDYRLKILLLHQSLKQDQNIGYDFDGEKIGLDRFDYVFLGHFHKKILRYDNETDTVYHYIGSLNSCNVTELEDEMLYGRGYSVFDTDTYSLEQKTIEPNRHYLHYSLKDEELNEDFINTLNKSLTEHSKKPIIQLDIKTDNAQDVYDMCKKLEDNALIVKSKIIPKIIETDHQIVSTGFNSIEKIIRQKFDEEWKADFCMELMQQLSNNKIDEAKELANKIYKEKFYNQQST